MSHTAPVFSPLQGQGCEKRRTLRAVFERTWRCEESLHLLTCPSGIGTVSCGPVLAGDIVRLHGSAGCSPPTEVHPLEVEPAFCKATKNDSVAKVSFKRAGHGYSKDIRHNLFQVLAPLVRDFFEEGEILDNFSPR